MVTDDNGASSAPKDGLKSAAEYLKYTLALATGSLVFSAGLVGKDVRVSTEAGWFLIAAWGLLVTAIVAGLIAFARVPVLLHDANYDLKDPFVVWPWRVHQVAFAFGIISLGIALVLVLLTKGAA